jgi:hypothetical protein
MELGVSVPGKLGATLGADRPTNERDNVVLVSTCYKLCNQVVQRRSAMGAVARVAGR